MTRIAFLSRGHGFGHAAKDLRLVEAMRDMRPGLEIIIASSGTGLQYYQSRSVPCIDLDIPDENDQSYDVAKRLLHFLAQVGKLDLVVADEVFSAPTVCKVLRVSNLLLTHWFFSEIDIPHIDQLLRHADGIVLLDFAEAHQVPAQLTVPVHFTGPLTTKFAMSRDQARRQLGLTPESVAAVLTFGSIRPDKILDIRAMLQTAFAAWLGNPRDVDRLFVLAEPIDELGVKEITQGESVHWVGITKTPETFYAAADLVLAYATFTTLCDLARNGIPTIGIIGSLNPVDRLHAEYLGSVGLIQTADLSIEPEELLLLGRHARQRRTFSQSIGASMKWGDPRSIAALILSYLPTD